MPYPYRPKHCLTLALGVFCMVVPTRAAHADDPPQGSSGPSSWLESAGQQAAEWNLVLGGGFRVEPKFEGANAAAIIWKIGCRGPQPALLAFHSTDFEWLGLIDGVNRRSTVAPPSGGANRLGRHGS
jgi:hypothetical protein